MSAITIVVEPDEGQFHAYCPELRGLHVEGKTVEEALEMAGEALTAYNAVDAGPQRDAFIRVNPTARGGPMSLQQAAQELVDRLEIAAVAWHRQHRQDDEVAHCNHQSCQRNKAAINGGREALAQSGEREALSITHVPQVEQNYLSRGSG